MIKKIILASLASLPLLFAHSAEAAPRLGYGAVGTPYGLFGCRQRAESKLYSIGATGIQKTNNSNTTWAYLGNFSIGVWCRGDEAVILVSGDSDTMELINEIKSAF